MSKQDTEYAPVKYELRKIADLKNWEDNPRTITEDDFMRLQEHIRRLGVYKPLVINQDGIVLGGNMRLRALRDLGIEEVMCSVVTTDNEKQMIEYALSDNDQMGETDEQKLAEIVTLHPVKENLFAIQTTKLKPIESVLSSHGPSNDQNQEQKCRQCPLHCGMDNL